MAQSTALVSQEVLDFKFPALADNDFSIEELNDDAVGVQISMTKVKIPSGGGIAFEVPQADSEDPRVETKLVGVIMHHHPMYSYWDGDNQDENLPPNCISMDGETGVGDPGTTCKDCPHNQWGTGKEGNGKACKNGANIYLLQSGEFLPYQLQLPPTSVKPFHQLISMFRSRMRKSCGSLIEISLRKAVNGNGKEYSVAKFRLLDDFSGEQLQQAKMLAATMKEQINEMNMQQSAMMLDRQNQDTINSAYEEAPPTAEGNNNTEAVGTGFGDIAGDDGDDLPWETN